MLYREIIAICSQIQTTRTNAQCNFFWILTLAVHMLTIVLQPATLI